MHQRPTLLALFILMLASSRVPASDPPAPDGPDSTRGALSDAAASATHAGPASEAEIPSGRKPNPSGGDSMYVFPRVRGSNLEGRDFDLPEDFEGERNLVFIAFERGQQAEVDTWVPPTLRLLDEHPDLRYYELPTIKRLNPVTRWFINRGMAGGIHDPKARAATITLYLDKEEFNEALQITTEEEIAVLLVGRDGRVQWRVEGAWTQAKEGSLREALGERYSGPAR